MHALDIETVKKYVELGFGIALVPTIAIDRRVDRGLRAIDASHIFEPAIASVITQDDLPSHQYILDFINMKCLFGAIINTLGTALHRAPLCSCGANRASTPALRGAASDMALQ